MFTGLVESVQPVRSNRSITNGRQLCIPLGHLADDAKLGDSICVNGVCLTISKLDGETAWFDVMAETVRVSTLDDIKPGDRVNLERALMAGGRLGGHIVQGHVDGIGKIDKIDQQTGKITIRITTPPQVLRFMIDKGSVAIDGISLTIVSVEKQHFNVSIIPITWQETNLIHRKPGDQVNLEADIISKWIRTRLDQILPDTSTSGNLTLKKLQEEGFI